MILIVRTYATAWKWPVAKFYSKLNATFIPIQIKHLTLISFQQFGADDIFDDENLINFVRFIAN